MNYRRIRPSFDQFVINAEGSAMRNGSSTYRTALEGLYEEQGEVLHELANIRTIVDGIESEIVRMRALLDEMRKLDQR